MLQFWKEDLPHRSRRRRAYRTVGLINNVHVQLLDARERLLVLRSIYSWKIYIDEGTRGCGSKLILQKFLIACTSLLTVFFPSFPGLFSSPSPSRLPSTSNFTYSIREDCATILLHLSFFFLFFMNKSIPERASFRSPERVLLRGKPRRDEGIN